MSRMLTLTVAVAALMAAASAGSAARFEDGYKALDDDRFAAGIVLAQYGDDDDDDDEDDDDDDDDGVLFVDDFADCEPGKFYMAEIGDIEVPLPCK